ncbi:DJ-1/PfpI family protein [Oceanicella sp. SM1341]|uniref:DJ-1/PfpI family protein n=1 Tax=Oceanicella sp. SM1341 TaxID=1548889 RepID=UPI000E483112|nr:DJ-1/PfpI family protein [Oceanicella sp. SM1341]
MTIRIGLLLFPDLTQLDLTGPLEVFSRMPGAEVSLLWKTLEPVRSDRGLGLLPDMRLADCEALDILCVPGGPGQIALMEDAEVLGALRRLAPGCRLVTSVCTGSLVLAAAGLLTGRRATCHWSSLDQLALFGAEPVAERVVRDGNRITGAGVTSGIDFALAVAAEVLGEEAAREIQLQIEYDPAPPFDSGAPRTAAPELLARVTERIAPFIARRRAASEAAAARLG